MENRTRNFRETNVSFKNRELKIVKEKGVHFFLTFILP